MFERPEGLTKYGIRDNPKAYYSLGWTNAPAARGDGMNSWHMGSLPGTATLLLRRHDGRNVAILFNARSSPHAEHFGKTIKAQLLQAIDKVDDWPAINLFEKY